MMVGSYLPHCNYNSVHASRSRQSMRRASVAFCIFYIACLQGTVTPIDPAKVRYITMYTLKLTPTVSPPLPFKYGETTLVTFNYSFIAHNVTVYPKKGWAVEVSVDNENVANIKGQQMFYIKFDEPNGNISVEVEGDNAGRSRLRFRIQDWMDYPVTASDLSSFGHALGEQIYRDSTFPLYVIMKTRIIDHVFNIVVFLLVITANIGMGTQVDMEIVKSQIRRPVAPAIGLFSQFFFMPVTAYAVAVALEMEPGVALGLFACGCAPGGLASNIFTYLLRGNISLSITMTLVSTLASLGLLPMWLFTLGTQLYSGSDIKIPFLNIIISLFVIVIPTVIGLFMKAKTPRAAAVLIKATKLIMAAVMVFMFTFGVYANWWVLDLVDAQIFIASAALPYLGFIFGGFAAFVGRRSTDDIVTIAVETGIQNTAVPIVLLRMSLTGPEQATSIVVPLISSTLTPVPLVFAVIYLEIKSCRQRKNITLQPEVEPEISSPMSESTSEEKMRSAFDSTPIDPVVSRPVSRASSKRARGLHSAHSEPKQSTNKKRVAATRLHQQTNKGWSSREKRVGVAVN